MKVLLACLYILLGYCAGRAMRHYRRWKLSVGGNQ